MTLRYRHLVPSSEVLAQTVDEDAVLLDLKSEQYFSLNAVGRRVWELLQETADVAQIRDRLLREYEVESDALEHDLNDLLARLLQAGLVHEKPGAAP